MDNVVYLHHARTSSACGQRSGRKSDRDTPVSRSIDNTNSAGTPRFDRVSQYQTWDCVVPIRSAKGFCPPANSHARLSASVVDMAPTYPNLGGKQPKNLWTTSDRILGTNVGMDKDADPKGFGRRLKERRTELGLSQGDLAKAANYSQSNVGWLESGAAKDIRTQAMDFAKPLRTTVDWLLWEKGPKDDGPHVMTDDEVLKTYNSLPLDEREAISDILAKYVQNKKKARKSG